MHTLSRAHTCVHTHTQRREKEGGRKTGRLVGLDKVTCFFSGRGPVPTGNPEVLVKFLRPLETKSKLRKVVVEGR